MRAALLVGEGDGGQRAASKADLGGLHVADQRVRAVAADLLLVNQLYGRTRRETVKIVTVRERILQRIDDWLGDTLFGGRVLEVVLDLEGHLDGANVVLDWPQSGFQHAGAEARRGHRGVLIDIVLDAAHRAGFGILIQRQRMAALKIAIRDDALDVRRPLVRVARLHPSVAEVAFDRRGAIEHRADRD